MTTQREVLTMLELARGIQGGDWLSSSEEDGSNYMDFGRPRLPGLQSLFGAIGVSKDEQTVIHVIVFCSDKGAINWNIALLTEFGGKDAETEIVPLRQAIERLEKCNARGTLSRDQMILATKTAKKSYVC